ncbi:MAG: hypothetical protein IT453_20070, partial [Planctomycetes bacterium]|nr:hypothetical protein [Planctomycetota bacterium]
DGAVAPARTDDRVIDPFATFVADHDVHRLREPAQVDLDEPRIRARFAGDELDALDPHEHRPVAHAELDARLAGGETADRKRSASRRRNRTRQRAMLPLVLRSNRERHAHDHVVERESVVDDESTDDAGSAHQDDFEIVRTRVDRPDPGSDVSVGADFQSECRRWRNAAEHEPTVLCGELCFQTHVGPRASRPRSRRNVHADSRPLDRSAEIVEHSA